MNLSIFFGKLNHLIGKLLQMMQRPDGLEGVLKLHIPAHYGEEEKKI
jgi:hypothetical protein